MQNSGFWFRITSLYGSLTSPVGLCMQNGVISTGITCQHGFQPLSVAFAHKTASFGPELQVSTGTRTHLWFCACKTAWLAPELLVSMSPNPHLWFLHSKQRLLNQNYKSLWNPVLTWRFVHEKSVINNRITSLYESQPSSVVFACKTAAFGSELQVSTGPWPHLSVCACKTAWLAPDLPVSMGFSPYLWLLLAKQWLLDQNYKFLQVLELTCGCVHAKQRD